ncbi:hypothetical protein I8U33_004767, partial [Escherichia coli]
MTQANLSETLFKPRFKHPETLNRPGFPGECFIC